MIDIDALSGRGLKVAVVMALGYTPSEHPSGGNWFFDPGGSLSHISDFPDCPTDIAAAWELDGDGWRWEHNDYYCLYPGNIKVMQVRVTLPDYYCFDGFAEWVNLEDKAAAYAVARCRAWLKAQQAGAAQ